jgi:uncharacterized protein
VRKQSPFVIKLREIPPEGMTRTFDLAGDWARGALKGTEAQVVPPDGLTAEVELMKSQEDVYARGTIAGVLTLPCSRCLTPAPLAVKSDFEITYVPAGAEADVDEELEVTDEMADTATYENDEVDLEEMLREEVLLTLPIAHPCKESCKGLCATCGQNLNEGTCNCPPPPTDDRWAALKNVKV